MRPTVVGFTGHRVVPIEIASSVDEQLAAALVSFGPEPVGVCCLASGADQRFASILLAAGGSLNAVVPAHGYEAAFDSERDLVRYRSLLARASHVELLDFPRPTDDAYAAAGRRVVESADAVIAVWDGEPPRGRGGTGEVVAYARRLGRPITIIWPPGATRR